MENSKTYSFKIQSVSKHVFSQCLNSNEKK